MREQQESSTRSRAKTRRQDCVLFAVSIVFLFGLIAGISLGVGLFTEGQFLAAIWTFGFVFISLPISSVWFYGMFVMIKSRLELRSAYAAGLYDDSSGESPE